MTGELGRIIPRLAFDALAVLSITAIASIIVLGWPVRESWAKPLAAALLTCCGLLVYATSIRGVNPYVE